MMTTIKAFVKSSRTTIGIYALSILASFLIIGVVIFLLGKNPWIAYYFFVREAALTQFGLGETLVRATPLLFCGLGLAIAFTAKYWNVGAEGQMYFGAISSTWFALLLWDKVQNPVISLTLILAVGFAGGALWSLLPALLKARLGVNEIISTLMLNFVAILFLQYLVWGPWKDPQAQQNWSLSFPQVLHLPIIVPGTRLHVGFLLALACLPLVMLLLKKSVLGYEITALGASAEAARYGGIDISSTTLKIATLSGGLAGLAGVSEIFGVQFRLIDGFSLGFGYTAIMVAWLGKNEALGVLLISIFFGAILNGGDAMQRGAGVPMAVSSALMGLILALVLITEMLVRWRRRK